MAPARSASPAASLLLRNARPIAFGPGLPDGQRIDVLIGADGRVAAVGPGLPGAPGLPAVDLGGSWLSPGWADLHTHVYWGATDISVRVREVGAATGVLTLVDAGSAGEANFAGFREYVAEPARERVLSFLNIGSIGLVACNRVSELIDARSIDIDRTLACIEANRDIIRGVKVRASGVIVGAWGVAPARIASKVAKLAGLPLMVHVGEAPPLVEEVFELLRPGDIVTHCFHGKRGGNILEDPDLFDMARELQARGVVLDIGHGVASFSYEVGADAIRRGLLPTTISTDLHQHNLHGPVWDLSLVMSKLLALGMPLDAVVTGATRNVLRAVGEPHEALLEPGAPARFTVFDLVDAELSLPDSMRRDLRLSQRLVPRLAILGDTVIEAASNHRRAGGEPDSHRRAGGEPDNHRPAGVDHG
ncbi:amidohydrolase/deacetylase family metallohydrolase [Arenibaculum sp.]|jgi:dihydroorotase|uniref:amidohydrolase/deacetylase family metallohydrolase n=1 Tax=Arenibaculum sp. TaxID=2865862 RepID=UPI002E149670|nr:amidohydrolase/deacetylase family metallohydrolase [Arenibaculum sp.]